MTICLEHRVTVTVTTVQVNSVADGRMQNNRLMQCGLPLSADCQ